MTWSGTGLGRRWIVPPPEGGFHSDCVEADTAARSCRRMLRQALDGPSKLTDARFVLDDRSVVYGHRGMMSAR